MEDIIRRGLTETAAILKRIGDEMAPQIAQAVRRCLECLQAGGKILLCGNGGSASQAQHLAGELVGRFRRERRGLPALALTADSAILTALGNDYGFEEVFRRQVEALARAGDVLFALSTSGNALNVLRAVEEARARQVYTIALTGQPGGCLAEAADLCLCVPHHQTSIVQEAHLAIGHLLCELIEAGMTEAV